MPSASAGPRAGRSPAKRAVSRSRSTRASPSTGAGPDGSDRLLGERAGHRRPVCHRAPPSEGRHDRGTGAVRRTAERADTSVSRTTPAATSAGSQSWPSGTTPSCRATANGTTVASEASSPRATPTPATKPGLGEHRALAPGSASRPAATGGAARPCGARPTAAKVLTTTTAANTTIMPTMTLLSRLMVRASWSAPAGRVRWSMPTSHQHADGRRGQHDDRCQHPAEQVRPAAGVVRRQVADAPPAPTSRRASTRRCSSHGATLARPRPRRGSRSSRRCCIAAYGSGSCGGDGDGDHAHGQPVADQQHGGDDPPPAAAVAARPRASLGAKRGRSAGGTAGGDRSATRLASTMQQRGGGRRRARVVADRARPRPRCRAAGQQQRPGRPRRRAPRPHGGEHGDEQALGPDQAASLAWRGADGAQQADLDLALADGDAERRGDGEEHDERCPSRRRRRP